MIRGAYLFTLAHALTFEGVQGGIDVFCILRCTKVHRKAANARGRLPNP
ncbi:hypothetical protein RGUI_0345 [Rhodovulum sp. P5]|nr:hypothetical protein RGUI_0345 [Rhodovulum sp. P5]